jgi:hypothetical protein
MFKVIMAMSNFIPTFAVESWPNEWKKQKRPLTIVNGLLVLYGFSKVYLTTYAIGLLARHSIGDVFTTTFGSHGTPRAER